MWPIDLGWPLLLLSRISGRETLRLTEGHGVATWRVQQGNRAVGMRRRKPGKPRGPTCRWTPDLDEILKAAWARGGLRAARHAIRALQPTWSHYSIKRRAAILELRRPRPPRWSSRDEYNLERWIEGNASLALIAKRLGRSVAAVRKRLWHLGHKAESLGGYKVKEVAEMLTVPPARVQYWVGEGLLLTKGGRITDHSFSTFLREHSSKVPFESLKPDMQAWLVEMGYLSEIFGQKLQKAAGG
jgi:hypothetical protein